MLQGAAIKKLFKIFLFIFSIYFKGKNIFLFWESMQATNDNKYISLLGKHANMLFYIFSICYPFHFKYIFKGKKHNKKENTKEVSCLGLIQNQFWPVSAIGRYNLIRSIRPDSGRIGPVRCEFVKKKKKTLDAASTRGQPRRWPHLILDSGVAPSQLRQCFLEQITIDIQF